MTDTCPKCGRPTERNADLPTWNPRSYAPVGVRYRADGPGCIAAQEIVAAAYQRGRRDGIDEGVRIARERHRYRFIGDELAEDWRAVEAEAAKAKERTP